jgi:MFS family permease
MVIVSALVSVAVAFLASRWMTALGPTRLVPAAFALSAGLLLAWWALVGPFRQGVAIALYLHYAALGAVLISGFWSVVNERFDPRTAKRYVGRIAAGATVGGVLGGLLAERVGATLSIEAMLPILAGIHFLCAFVVYGVPGERRPVPSRGPQDERPSGRSGLKTLAQTPYLRGLVALVLLATVTEVLIDYVFKARATGALGSGESLLRFFAAFYTAISLLTVLVQAAASRATLQHLGLTRTVALLPAVTGLGSAGALAFPGLASAAAARGSEQVLRNGLYRAGYELLFTPLQPEQKRATKTLVDVGVVRFGDILGAAMVQVLLLLAVAGVNRVLLALAVVLSIVAVAVALGLRRGYVSTLERSLVSRAVELDLEEVEDITTRTAVLHSAGGMGLTDVYSVGTMGLTDVYATAKASDAATAPVAEAADRPEAPRPAPPRDPELARIADLRSRDAGRVTAVLGAGRLTPALVPHVIPLLAWDEVVPSALAALREVAHLVTGQLADRLLDHGEEFAVRRRLPLALVASPTERALDALFRGLEDPRFEVRYRCGRAMVRLLELNPKLRVERERAFDAVLREVAVDRGVWESHRLLDQMEDEAWSPVMDEVLRKRANRSLEHVFTVLSLVLPRQPLKIAFRGLHTRDAILRGTALEYLETALPEHVRVQLWPFLEDTRPRRRDSRPTDEVLQDLLQSNQSIILNLKELRQQKKGDSG